MKDGQLASLSRCQATIYGPVTDFISSSIEIIFRQSWVSYYEVPSLMRGWVCNLLVQLLLGFDRTATLRPMSRSTGDHNLLSHMRVPHPRGPGPHICIP
jgi:hypothetical protein